MPTDIRYDSVVDLESLDGGMEEREAYSARRLRLHPHTALGKTIGDQLLVLPPKIAEFISELTKRHTPQILRQHAARYYQDLTARESHAPATDYREVDTHLVALFLQTYASIYSVLSEAKRRLGDDWRPNRILDVGFGPSTGMIALNQIFEDAGLDKGDWDPVKKTSVVIGHPKMKKYAKHLLRTQLHEAVNEVEKSEGASVRSVFDEGLGEEGGQEAAELDELAEELAEDDSPKADPPGQRTVVQTALPAFDSPEKYDLIIATHQLFRSRHQYPASVDDHTHHLLSLLEPNGVLILIERGEPTGFESIARARQIMLRPEDYSGDTSKTPREYKRFQNVADTRGMLSTETLPEKVEKPYQLKVLAPCSHHGACPLQVGLNVRNNAKPGFFNWCNFGQMIQRPKYTQELKKGKYLAAEWDEEGQGAGGKYLAGSGRPYGKSYETASHSYLIVQRLGHKSEEDYISHSDNWPRILRQPMKRDKHVIMEMCAPNGTVEQWTVTKSFNKQAYHDARKATGGDLWALSAKNFQARGGNRSQLEKVKRKNMDLSKQAPAKDSQGIADEEGEEDEEDFAVRIDNDAWQGRSTFSRQRVNSRTGFDLADDSQSLDDYFEEMGNHIVKSAKYQRQVRSERKSVYQEKKRSIHKW